MGAIQKGVTNNNNNDTYNDNYKIQPQENDIRHRALLNYVYLD